MVITTSGPELTQSKTPGEIEAGPHSKALAARKPAAGPPPVGPTMPAYTARAGRGVLADVAGNTFMDLGSGIAVTSIGNSAPAVVEAITRQAATFTHTCFMVTPYSGYVEVAELLNRITPGDFDKKSALFNSGAEGVENA